MQFLEDTYLFNSQTQIKSIGSDEKGQFLTFDDTIFYPQGGGQPFDLGTISTKSTMVVTGVFFDPALGQIKHYVSSMPQSLKVGETVRMSIDAQRRLMNARNHTSGHLLTFAVESNSPCKGVKGYHFNEGCYVEFDSVVPLQAAQIEQIVNQYISQSLPITQRFVHSGNLIGGKPSRIMEVASLGVMGCGGTHVSNTREIGSFKIRKMKTTKGKTKISYSIG